MPKTKKNRNGRPKTVVSSYLICATRNYLAFSGKVPCFMSVVHGRIVLMKVFCLNRQVRPALAEPRFSRLIYSAGKPQKGSKLLQHREPWVHRADNRSAYSPSILRSHLHSRVEGDDVTLRGCAGERSTAQMYAMTLFLTMLPSGDHESCKDRSS